MSEKRIVVGFVESVQAEAKTFKNGFISRGIQLQDEKTGQTDWHNVTGKSLDEVNKQFAGVKKNARIELQEEQSGKYWNIVALKVLGQRELGENKPNGQSNGETTADDWKEKDRRMSKHECLKYTLESFGVEKKKPTDEILERAQAFYLWANTDIQKPVEQEEAAKEK